MTDNRLTAKTELTETPNANDVLYVVDVSDTTDSPEGTSKKIKYSNISSGGGISEAIPYTPIVKADKKYISTDVNKHTQTADIFFSVNSTGAVIDNGYVLEVIGNGDKCYFSNDFGSVNPPLLSETNSLVLENGTMYTFVFYWTGAKMNIMYSESDVIALTQLNPASINNVVFDNSTDVTVTLTDTNTTLNEVETEVYWSIKDANTWTLGDTVIQDGTTANITGLSDSNSYDFRALAKGDNVYSLDAEYSTVFTLTTTILFQDNFNDNVIDPAKWTIVGAQGKITEANQRLEFNLNHSQDIVGNNLEHAIKVNTTFNSGKIWFQTDYETPNTQANSGLVHFGLYKTSDGNNSNCIRIIGDSTNIGKVKIQVFSGSSKVYELANVGSFNTTYKIGYDVATNDIQFFELTAPDTWTQLGTTQNYDIIGNEGIETLTALFSVNDSITATQYDYTYADNVYISNADYSTSTP